MNAQTECDIIGSIKQTASINTKQNTQNKYKRQQSLNYIILS